VLLSERHGHLTQIQELQKLLEESKKQINQLKTQISLLNIELTDKEEDIVEAKNTMNEKIND
jgi:peptidoglycan hydrolase CwlO-like protein